MKKLFTLKVISFCFFCLYFSDSLKAQRIIISGKITGKKNEKLYGASVTITGKKARVITNIDGFYLLKLLVKADSLTVSCRGYEKLTVAIGTSKKINVQLKKIPETEYITIGYGSVLKKDVTGAVAHLESKDFLQGTIISPDQLLLGKIAGVQITSATGAAGDAGRMRIRGTSSLYGSNEPLFVIDGMPIYTTNLSLEEVANTDNPLNLINPNDIESITVLKDATAQAIFGAPAQQVLFW